MALLKKRPKTSQEKTENNETSSPFPTSMDEYKFEGRIGKGAFASVFIAKCLSKNEKVAIKVIELELTPQDKKKNYANNEKCNNENINDKKCNNNNSNDNNNDNNNEDGNNDISWDEIQKEAAIMSRMNHKNIVSCYTSFSVSTELWLVMPLLIGSCLDIMKSIQEYNFGFIDEYIISTIISDVLNGVLYIHNDGRVHRDIKSANILLSSNGICQISDFGVSGAIIEGGLRKNGRHTFTGSLWWMAPEVLQRENKHSYKADIWSLGITALELAFGKPPHSKQRPVKVMLTILQSQPPTIQSQLEIQSQCNNRKYSKKFKDFLNKCLRKDARTRSSANILLNHSFIKQSKNNQYLFDKIISKYNKISKKNELNNNILPYSVSQKLLPKKSKNKKIKINNNNNNNFTNSVTIDDSTNIESNGFDFNSEINSISHSEQQFEQQTQQQTEQQTEQQTQQQKLGRFDVTVQNKNDTTAPTTTTTKGRFRVKKIT